MLHRHFFQDGAGAAEKAIVMPQTFSEHLLYDRSGGGTQKRLQRELLRNHRVNRPMEQYEELRNSTTSTQRKPGKSGGGKPVSDELLRVSWSLGGRGFLNTTQSAKCNESGETQLQ